MCRDGIAILSLNYAISLNRFVLCFVILKKLGIIAFFVAISKQAYLDIIYSISRHVFQLL